MKTDNFTDFIRKLPAPLGYKGLNIDKTKLDKIIFCLNIRDHEGYVYFPEVMWAIFYSIIGKNDKELHDCKPMRNILRKVKNKYVALGRNTSLDMLCGNKFYRNEITVTKYMSGKIILNNMRKLVEASKLKAIKEGKPPVQTKTSESTKGWKNNPISRLCTSISKKPIDVSWEEFKNKKKIIVTSKTGDNSDMKVVKETEANK